MKKLVTSFTSLLIVIAMSIICSAVAFADTIRLKDGSVLRGKVVVFTQKKFTIIVYVGGSASQHNINAEDIESIEFDSTNVSTSQIPRAEQNNSTDTGLVKVEPPSNDTSISDTASNSPPPTFEKNRSKPAGNIPASNINDDRPMEGIDRPKNSPENIREKPGMPDTDATVIDKEKSMKAVDRKAAKNVAFVGDKSVNVAAEADWTSTEIRIQKGQRIFINVSGEIELGNNVLSTAEGIEISDHRKLIPNKPTGSLIAVIGDDNDDFIFVGKSMEFTAPRNGVLFLSVNEGNLKDNAGSYTAKLRIQ